MDCFNSCIMRRGLLWAIIGALVGAGIAVLLTFLWQCIALGGILGLAGGPAGATVGISIVCTGVGIALLPYIIIAAISGAVIGALLGFLAAVMWCGVECELAASSADAPGIVGYPGLFPGHVLDCSAATATVESFEEQLASLLTSLDAQETNVESRLAGVTAARNAVAVSMLAMAAASFWNPLAASAAAIAVVGAMTAMAVALRRLVEAQVKVAELKARIAAFETALAVAREVQASLCGDGVPVANGLSAVDSVGTIDTPLAGSK